MLAALQGHTILDKTHKANVQVVGRRLAVKAGCIVVEEAVESAITEGVYIIIENLKTGLPYVGQAKNVLKRLNQHVSKKISSLDKIVAVFNLEGFSKHQREVFEQLVIDELGGIENLGNKVNPVGKKRYKKFEKAGKIFKICK